VYIQAGRQAGNKVDYNKVKANREKEGTCGYSRVQKRENLNT
jgi:hypothetical protein